MLVVVDGRTEQAAGMSLDELAQVMLALGCVDAMNLDGGGSSALWARTHGVVSHPCDNKAFDHEGERKVANAIVLRAPLVRVLDGVDATREPADGWARREDPRAVGGGWLTAEAGSRHRLSWSVGLPPGRYEVAIKGFHELVLPVVQAGDQLMGGPIRSDGWFVVGELLVETPDPMALRLDGVLPGPLHFDALRLRQAKTQPDTR